MVSIIVTIATIIMFAFACFLMAAVAKLFEFVLMGLILSMGLEGSRFVSWAANHPWLWFAILYIAAWAVFMSAAILNAS
jgi:hypothetical protein